MSQVTRQVFCMDEDWLTYAFAGAIALGVYLAIAYVSFSALHSLFGLPVLVNVALILVLSLAITAGFIWVVGSGNSSAGMGCSTTLAFFAIFSSGVVLVSIAIVRSVLVLPT